MAEHRRAAIWTSDIQRITGNSPLAIKIVVFLLVIWALWSAKVFLIPVAIAALASSALDPVHRRLVRLGLPRSLSAAGVTIGVVAMLAGSAWALRGSATTFVNRLPVLTQKLRDAMRDGRSALGSTIQPVQQAADDLKKAAEESGPPPQRGVTRVQVEDPPTRMSDLLWQGTMSAMGGLLQATMVLFLVYYVLASGPRYKEKLVTISGPSLFRKHLTAEIINRITEQIERFLVVRVIITFIVAVATTGALAALGVSQAVIWGLLTGLLNNIPYVGPSVAVAAVALAALVQFGTFEMMLAAGGATMVISVIEGFALTPWMMGRAGRMNTGVVFLSLMFWGWIWGVWGMLLAVPIMMAVKAICDHVEAFAPISELLSE